MAKRSPEERFWEKVNKYGPIPAHRRDLGPCWVWMARRHRQGYGCFWPGDEMVLAHRFAYELLVGPIPDGLVMDHLCCQTFCVRPSHLEPVTQGENTLRGASWAGRHARATHCIHGHLLAGANLYANTRGHRQCRTCARARAKARRKRDPGSVRRKDREAMARHRARKRAEKESG